MKSLEGNDATGATQDTRRGATPAQYDATQDATPRGNDATGATLATEGATLWLSVARAAQLEGVSVRAVQRRCQSGKYRVRRTQTPQGERLEVDAATLATHDATHAKNDATQGRDARDGEEEKRRDTSDALSIAAPIPETQTGEGKPLSEGRDFAALYVERLEGENDFLRRTLEQRDRDAAELRAALREALKIAPRQLDAPEAPPVRPPSAAPSLASPEKQAPAASPQDAKERAPAKEPRPLWKVVLGIR
jgi:hypothetical protein